MYYVLLKYYRNFIISNSFVFLTTTNLGVTYLEIQSTCMLPTEKHDLKNN